MNDIFVWQGFSKGGAERITLEAAKYFAKAGAQVTLGMFQYDPSLSLPQIVFNVPGWIPSSFRPLFASLTYRLKHSHNFGAVYTHTLGAWKTRTNYLFVHEAADLDRFLAHRPNILQGLAAYLWKRLYLHLCLRPATTIFSATPEATRFFLKHKIKSNRIVATGSFYDEKVFQCVKRAQPSKPYQIIFVGNPSDNRKRFALIHQHYFDKKDFIVHVVGGALQKKERNFIFHGYVSPTELFGLLKNADVFILPSQSEGFSIALLEALATGIPCVVNTAIVPASIADAPNLCTFSREDDIDEVVQRIIRDFDRFNVCNKNIEVFSSEAILSKEYEHVKKYFS